MTAEAEVEPTGPVQGEVVTPPEPLERGRYAVYPTADGGWAVARSAPICESCQACGCGQQAEPFIIPAIAVTLITGEADAKLRDIMADPRVKLRDIMRVVTGRG